VALTAFYIVIIGAVGSARKANNDGGFEGRMRRRVWMLEGF
jgi:hypothetical protein